MADPVTDLDAVVGRVTRALRASEEREVDHISLNVDESDLRALLAAVDAGREDAKQDARATYERFAAEYPQKVDGFSVYVATWDEQEEVGQRLSTHLYTEGGKARDAEWRAAVERFKADSLTGWRGDLRNGGLAALDALLAAMEVGRG